MKKRLVLLAAALSAALLFFGCVSTDDFKRMQQRVSQLQIQVRDLKDQSKLRDMELERRIKQARGNLPDMRLELDRLRGEIQRLTNEIELAGQRAGLQGQSLPLGAQLNHMRARLDRLEAALSLPPMEPPEAAAAEEGPEIEVQPDEESPPPPPEPEAEADEEQSPGAAETEYRVAEALYKRQVYPAALEKFRAFMQNKEFRRSRFAPSAQFYIGESLYQQKNYEEAILEYQKVIQNYPKSSKVPSALLKQAFSFLNIGDKTSAKLLLQKIIREHPKSYAAGVARKKLPRIN